jgi:RND family efflux transporter MFP subunit
MKLCTYVLLGCTLCACGGQEPALEPVRPVRSILVGDASEYLGRWFPGYAKATREVNIAFEVGGQIIQLPVKAGDVVEQGQLLATLDPRDYENDLQSAKAQLLQAETLRARLVEPASVGAVSQQELTDATARRDVASASFSIKEKALADSRIVAPFAGVVTATYVENFQNVRPNEPVLRLLDNSRVELVINVPEGSIPYASQLADVHCRFDAFPDKDIPASVWDVSQEASETTRTYEVTLIMDQPADFEILPGMSGEATARRSDVVDSGAGFLLPTSALRQGEDGLDYVWRIDEATSTAHRQEVTRGALTSLGIRVTGLESGQRIATAGSHYLREGQRVRVPALPTDNSSQ